jgi:UDP-N-acetylmuramoyl-tripeptide--D-alanyl-D-alanine ligase
MTKVKIHIEDLFSLTGSVIYNPDSFKPSSIVSTDTRKMKKNSIFIALAGDKFDGHSFVNDAVKNGASTVIINKNKLKKFDNLDTTIVTVPDTTIAYGELAKAWRKKLRAKVIAISGSNGKTGTKEILATILEEKYTISKTIANNNNHIGVPLTIFETNEKHDVLVLELGTNHFGEIRYISKIACPDLALITNIGASHLEFLKDLDGVANEKTALFEETEICGGKILLNTDDDYLKARTKNIKNKLTFGFKGKPGVKGKVSGISDDARAVLKITNKDYDFEVKLPVFGITNAKNFLAAAAAALELGLTPEEIISGAAKLTSVDKRLNVKILEKLILINDTYNANPESMKAAFEFMNAFKGKRRKVAVLGDMFELGKKSRQSHIGLAEYIIKNKIDEVYTTGNAMKNLYSSLGNGKIVKRHFSKREMLGEFLQHYNFSDTIVLVKGSRGMKMEDFAKIIEEKK